MKNAVERIFSCKISFSYSRERARQKFAKFSKNAVLPLRGGQVVALLASVTCAADFENQGFQTGGRRQVYCGMRRTENTTRGLFLRGDGKSKSHRRRREPRTPKSFSPGMERFRKIVLLEKLQGVKPATFIALKAAIFAPTV